MIHNFSYRLLLLSNRLLQPFIKIKDVDIVMIVEVHIAAGQDLIQDLALDHGRVPDLIRDQYPDQFLAQAQDL